MGIHPQTAALILKEHRYRPIAGDILTIGRQSVLLRPNAARRLVASEGIPIRPAHHLAIDESTVWGVPGTINDRSFFSMFSDGTVKALDVSEYEGAEIVHNLNEPLPMQHHNIADFIFNGSCLDDLFDPALAMRSLSSMLRPGGRIMHVESAVQHGGAFLCYSPEWFFDYYAINNYSDCRVFVCSYPRHLFQKWTVWEWQPFYSDKSGLRFSPMGPPPGRLMSLIVIAEKGANSTNDKIPIRASYRRLQKDVTDKVYVEAFHAYSNTTRQYQFGNTAGPTIKFRLLRLARRAVEALGVEFVNEGDGYKIQRRRARGMRRLGTIDFCD